MGSLGDAQCADIPTSGSGSVMGRLNLDFSAGTKTIPSHFPSSAGTTFEKKVLAKDGSTGVIEIQISCVGTTTSAYILMPISDFSGGQMGFEAFFQKDEATGSTFVDLFMEIDNGYMQVKQAMRVMAPNATSYKIYSLNVYGTAGNAIAIQGIPNGKTKAQMIYVQDVNSNDAGDAVIWGDLSGVSSSGLQQVDTSCIDLSNDSDATGCSNIDDPGAMSVNGTSYPYKLKSIKDLALSSIP